MLWMNANELPKRKDGEDDFISPTVIAVDNWGYFHCAYYHFKMEEWRTISFFMNKPLESEDWNVKLVAWRYLTEEEAEFEKGGLQ